MRSKEDALIRWLNDESPHASMTPDLSHDFAERLRFKLDEILYPQQGITTPASEYVNLKNNDEVGNSDIG